jgi:hypothetical protein
MTVYDEYARVHNGGVLVRYSKFDAWGRRPWPPSMAREFADHIHALADKADRDSERYRELLALLSDPDFPDETMNDLALRLLKAGYRKK